MIGADNGRDLVVILGLKWVAPCAVDRAGRRALLAISTCE
jgi:hypothetical protein